MRLGFCVCWKSGTIELWPWTSENLQFQLVSHVTHNWFNLVIKLYSDVTQHLKLCTWGFVCTEIRNTWVMVLELAKIFCVQLVSHVTHKLFDQESLDFIEMLLSIWNCAPLVLRVLEIRNGGVAALELVKSSNFPLVSYIAENLFDRESSNFTEMLFSI